MFLSLHHRVGDPTFFGRDGKLRGLKRQCYEGGIRIPFIVRWPGKVPEGTVINNIICAAR